LIGIISTLGVLAVYFWIVRPKGPEQEKQA
jgi:hypothetical protein